MPDRTTRTVSRRLALLAAVLLALSVSAPGTARQAPPRGEANRQGSAPVRLPDAEYKRGVDLLLKQLNDIRRKNGLKALKLNEDLAAPAQAHAEDMLRRQFFSHQNPEGEFALQRLLRLRPQAIMIGILENLSHISGEGAAPLEARVNEAYRGWLESPSHKRAMLDPTVTHVGFGIATRMNERGGEEYMVQVFGAPLGEWRDRPQSRITTPASMRARLEPGVEFIIRDLRNPTKRYPVPGDRSKYMEGYAAVAVREVTGATSVEIPALDPGTYMLLGRRKGMEHWYEIRNVEIRK